MTPDSNVVIARAARWHVRHAEARSAVEDVEDFVGHVALEAYSVLTRLPSAQRVAHGVVEHLRVEYPGERLTLPSAEREDCSTGWPGSASLAVPLYDPATGERSAFHTYSMRQAIEEGFILDVLRNYTTYAQF